MADFDLDIDRAAQEAVLLEARHAALVDGATRLNERAQANAPVDSGNLRRSHDVIEPDPDAQEAGVEATADYALYVHEGWSRKGRASISDPEGDDIEFEYEQASYAGNPWLARSVDELAAEEMG